jgi:hypothetical protein
MFQTFLKQEEGEVARRWSVISTWRLSKKIVPQTNQLMATELLLKKALSSKRLARTGRHKGLVSQLLTTGIGGRQLTPTLSRQLTPGTPQLDQTEASL